MILRILVFIVIELPLAILLIVCRTVANRPIVQHVWKCVVVDVCAEAVALILGHPSVQRAAAPLIAEGLHAFLSQTERVEDHVRDLTATVSKHQPDWARKQGEDFPLLLSSFFQGMVANMGHKQQQQQNGSRSSTLQQNETSTMVMLNVAAIPTSTNETNIDDDNCSTTECKRDD